jgi:hypothetical protein
MRTLPFLLMLVAAPAMAGENEITYGATSRALRSNSANAVTADSLVGGALTYARSLDFSIMPKLTLWAVGEFDWAGASGQLFQTMDTTTNSLGLTAGVRARYVPYRRLALSGRLQVGSERASLTLRSGEMSASDSGWGAVAIAAVAADLLAIDRPRFGFGIRVDVGYAAASPVPLTTTPERDGDVLRLPTMQSETGHLDLGGPFFGVSLMSQF